MVYFVDTNYALSSNQCWENNVWLAHNHVKHLSKKCNGIVFPIQILIFNFPFILSVIFSLSLLKQVTVSGTHCEVFVMHVDITILHSMICVVVDKLMIRYFSFTENMSVLLIIPHLGFCVNWKFFSSNSLFSLNFF